MTVSLRCVIDTNICISARRSCQSLGIDPET